MLHPYKSAPDKAFWDRAVSKGWLPEAIAQKSQPLVAPGQKVASGGSCFAANMIAYLEAAGIEYVRAEAPPEVFQKTYVEALNYHKFSAAYGNIYTARHLLQLLKRSLGEFHPTDDRWYSDGQVIDPFRPGLAFPASSDREFDVLTRQHLNCVIEAFRKADVFVFTLGLTEAWISSLDGAVFPTCPGTIAGEYDPNRHIFKNFTASETKADLLAAFIRIRTINPNMRFVVTVSPVPLVATATSDHVLAATIYSKSALRVAAQEVTLALPCISYFPAYEIIAGPQAPHGFYEANRREVSQGAVKTVMSAFLSACKTGAPAVPERPELADSVVSNIDGPSTSESDGKSALSALVARIECEEMATGL